MKSELPVYGVLFCCCRGQREACGVELELLNIYGLGASRAIGAVLKMLKYCESIDKAQRQAHRVRKRRRRSDGVQTRSEARESDELETERWGL